MGIWNDVFSEHKLNIMEGEREINAMWHRHGHGPPPTVAERQPIRSAVNLAEHVPERSTVNVAQRQPI